MAKYAKISLGDGHYCYSGPDCKKHNNNVLVSNARTELDKKLETIGKAEKNSELFRVEKLLDSTLEKLRDVFGTLETEDINIKLSLIQEELNELAKDSTNWNYMISAEKETREAFTKEITSFLSDKRSIILLSNPHNRNLVSVNSYALKNVVKPYAFKLEKAVMLKQAILLNDDINGIGITPSYEVTVEDISDDYRMDKTSSFRAAVAMQRDLQEQKDETFLRQAGYDSYEEYDSDNPDDSYDSYGEMSDILPNGNKTASITRNGKILTYWHPGHWGYNIRSKIVMGTTNFTYTYESKFRGKLFTD